MNISLYTKRDVKEMKKGIGNTLQGSPEDLFVLSEFFCR